MKNRKAAKPQGPADGSLAARAPPYQLMEPNQQQGEACPPRYVRMRALTHPSSWKQSLLRDGKQEGDPSQVPGLQDALELARLFELARVGLAAPHFTE